MNLPIISALIASGSYALFSYYYEPAVRSVVDPRRAAVILYCLAGTLLAALSAAVLCVSGEYFVWPRELVFFGIQISGQECLWAGLIGLICMAILYAIHIETEARSRKTIHMGIYAIIFQANVVVLSIADAALYHPLLSTRILIGSLCVIASSLSGLLLHLKSSRKSGKELQNFPAIPVAAVSATTCGLALFVDGELMRNFVFRESTVTSSVGLFLLYEASTFLIPSLLLLSAIAVFFGGPKFHFSSLRSEFMVMPKNFLLASCFSASQFVFSVLSLALPGPRLAPAAVLACAPFICVLFDGNTRSRKIILAEIVLALSAAVGIVIMTTSS